MKESKCIKLQSIDGKEYYLITAIGSKKIGVKHINSKINFSLSVHNTGLYKLIKDLHWTNYLTEREFLTQAMSYSKKSPFFIKNPRNWLLKFRKNGTIPDLILFKKSKRIAIEYERSRKSLEKYREIFSYHKKNIYNFGYYDEVRYYCSREIYTVLTKLLNDLYVIDFTQGFWKEMSAKNKNRFKENNKHKDITLVLLEKEANNG